jgi:6-phosphogluconate dehydrogenase
MHPQLVENAGSVARDFCMLERNILSHLKLALLLSLLSSSLLLQTRLIPGREEEHDAISEIPLACVQFLAAIAAICAGLWEYYNGYRDFRKMKALLTADKSVLLRSQNILWI